MNNDVLRPASKAWSDILPTIYRFFKIVKLPVTWRANKQFDVDFGAIQQLYKSRNVNIYEVFLSSSFCRTLSGGILCAI